MQETLDPTQFAWPYFHGPFNYHATPIKPLGCDIIAHKKTGTRHYLDFRGAAGWYVSVALKYYSCHTIVAKSTRATQISDTVEFRHNHLTQPTVTPMDRIFHGVNKLTCALHDAPHIACDNQLLAIDALHQAIQRWTKTKRPLQTKPHCTPLFHMRTRPCSTLRPMRRPQEEQPPASPPNVVIPKPPAILLPQIPIASHDEPIARSTISRFPSMYRAPPTNSKHLWCSSIQKVNILFLLDIF